MLAFLEVLKQMPEKSYPQECLPRRSAGSLYYLYCSPPVAARFSTLQRDFSIGLKQAALRPRARLPQSALSRGDLPNLVPIRLTEPEVATGKRCDALRLAVGGGDRELSDDAAGGDAPNLVPIVLTEPEVAVGASRNTGRIAVGGGD